MHEKRDGNRTANIISTCTAWNDHENNTGTLFDVVAQFWIGDM